MAKSKWPQVKDKLELVQKWARDGLTELQIAKNLGIGKSTLELYKNERPEFLHAIKKGKEPFITELENALVKRALGYEYEEVKTYIKDEGGKKVVYTEKTKKHMPADVGAAAILLKNKDPEHYTNDRALLEFKKQELELKKMLEEAKNW
jgi:hypothetical protein